MQIRYADKNDDLLKISDIYERSWKYAYKGIVPDSFLESIPRGRWAGRVESRLNSTLVVSVDGELIGVASICPSRWETYSEYGEISSIYLLPEYIGKGYGSSLFAKCVKELRLRGFDKILLWVLEGNEAGRKFYEKMGFACAEVYMDDNLGGKDLREVMYYKHFEN